MRTLRRLVVATFVLSLLEIAVGWMIGPGIIRPANLNLERLQQSKEMLQRVSATREDFEVAVTDGVILRGWKVRPADPNGDWVLLFHGVSDNRSGMLGGAEVLLRHGYSVVMMDSRAHGKSDGTIATYGWKERRDTVAIVQSLYATEHVRHLYAWGVSMGAAIAIQSAAVEPRVEAVVAEASFASLREVSYDYAGLEISPWIGKTIFRPATIAALNRAGHDGGFDPDAVSPEVAVGERAFPLLVICGTADRRIPCRHAERICRAAHGPCEIWAVEGAGHAAALGRAPQEFEERVIGFLHKN